MAITFVGATATPNTVAAGTTSVTLTDIAGAQEGDLYIVWVAHRNTRGFQTPSGWTKLLDQSSGNATVNTTGSIASGELFYTVRGASAPTLTFTEETTGTADTRFVRLIVYRGVNATSPIVGSAITTLGTAGTAVTTTGTIAIPAGSVPVILLAGARSGTVSGWTNSGSTGHTYTERDDDTTTSGADMSNSFADAAAITTTTSAVTFSATHSLSARHVIAAVVLRGTGIETLTDDFFDGSRDTAKWNLGNWEGISTTGVTVTEGSNVLSITPATSSATSAYSGYTSVNTYDLTGSSVFVKVTGRTSTTAGAETQFVAYNSTTSGILWLIEGNNLRAQTRNGGSTTEVGSLTYSSTTHAWLRIRESGGSVYWDTADDTAANPPTPAQWTNRFSATNPFIVSNLRVSLAAGTWQSVASPGTAVFDAFNTSTIAAANGGATVTSVAATSGLGSVSAGVLMESFRDNFDDNSISSSWTTLPGTGASIAEANGRLEFTIPDTYNDYTEVRTTVATKFIGSSMYIRVHPQSTAGSHQTFFQVYGGGSSFETAGGIGWLIDNNSIRARYRVGGTGTWVNVSGFSFPLAYTESTHYWFRMRESGGTLYWDTAPQTASNPPIESDWVNRATLSTSTINGPADGMYNIAFTNGAWAAETTGGGICYWDGLNTGENAPPGATVTGVVGTGAVGTVIANRPLGALLDAFSTGSLDTGKWSHTPTDGRTISLTNSRLNVTTPTDNNGFSNVDSTGSYAFANTYLFARMDMPTAAATGANEIGINAVDADTGNDGVRWIISGNTVFAQRIASGTATTLWDSITDGPGSFPANSSTFAWFRVRESNGTTYWDTAPSSASDPPQEVEWVNRASTATSNLAGNRSNYMARLRWGSWDTQTGAGYTGYFDSVNLVSTGAVSAPVTGVVGTTALGDETVNISVTVAETGFGATASLGSVTVSAAASAAATGVVGTTALGNETVSGSASVSVTGVAGTAALGTATVQIGQGAPVTGLQATTAVGSVTTSGAASVTLTGLAGTTQLGTAVAANSASVQVFGQQLTTYLGTVTLPERIFVNVTGFSATVDEGTVTIRNTGSVVPTGVVTNAVLGSAAQQTFPIYAKSKVGSFTLRSTAGSQTITGLGFTPKFVIFFVEEILTVSGAPELRRSIGVGQSSGSQWVSMGALRNSDGANTNQFLTNAVINLKSGWAGASTQIARAALTSLDTDGFTISVSTGAAKTVYYQAFGGSGLDVKVGTFSTSPAGATGDQSVTGVGFRPKGMIFIAAGKRTDSAEQVDVEQLIGFTDGNRQFAMNYYFNNNGTASFCNSSMHDGYCISGVRETNPPAWAYKGRVTTFDADGFSLYYPFSPFFSTTIGYVALAGAAQFKVDTFLERTTAGLQQITEPAFTPYGGLVISQGASLAAEELLGGVNMFSMFGSDASNVSGSFHSPYNSTATNRPVEVLSPVSVVAMTPKTGSGVTSSQANIASLNPTGFTLNWSKVTGTQFGSAYFVIGLTTPHASGVSATGNLGVVTTTAKASAPVTTVAGTASLGSVTAISTRFIEITGLSATTVVGDTDVIGKASAAPVGVEAVVEQGTFGYAGNFTGVNATGIEMASGLGSLTISGAASTNTTGVDATCQLGSIGIDGQVFTVVGVSGIEMNIRLSSIPAIFHNSIFVLGSVSAKVYTPEQLFVSVAQFGTMQALPGQWSSSVGSGEGGWSSVDPPDSSKWNPA